MKLFLIGLSFFIAIGSIGQTRQELIEEFMKERKKMMEQVMGMFQDDFDRDSFFSDDFDPFKSTKSFERKNESLKIEEKYEDDGSISLIITPVKENVSFDIKTENQNIIITSETKKITETTGQNSMKSFSSQKSSRSIHIPKGYKAKNPKASGKGIKISLVPVGNIKKIRDLDKEKKKMLKTPIGKRRGEQTI